MDTYCFNVNRLKFAFIQYNTLSCLVSAPSLFPYGLLTFLTQDDARCSLFNAYCLRKVYIEIVIWSQ